MNISTLTNQQLRALAHEVDAHGYRTTRACLAQHQFDANRMAIRAAKGRDRYWRDPIMRLPEARASARLNRSPRGWVRYGEIRQAVVSPASAVLP